MNWNCFREKYLMKRRNRCEGRLRDQLFIVFIALLCASCVFGQKTENCGQKKFPKHYKIVYNAVLDSTCGSYEVFIMNPDGTHKKNLSNWKGADWAYATFGDKIYFVSDRDTAARWWFLYEMDLNGNHIRKVFDQRLEDSYVTLNSTGEKMILKPLLKERNCFFVIDVKTGRVEDTLILPVLHAADPLYLPGDQQIVFRGNKVRKEAEELYLYDLNSADLKKLTNYPAADTTAKWYETHSGTPVWNASSNCITYFSKQAGNHSIHSVNLEGTEMKKLTDDSFNEGWHVWTSNGQFLVYDGSDLEDRNFDIYLKHIESGTIKRLTTESTVEQAPLLIETKKHR